MGICIYLLIFHRFFHEYIDYFIMATFWLYFIISRVIRRRDRKRVTEA